MSSPGFIKCTDLISRAAHLTPCNVSASFRTHLLIVSSFYDPLSPLPPCPALLRACHLHACHAERPTRADGQAKGAHEAGGPNPSETCSTVLIVAPTLTPLSPFLRRRPLFPSLPFACDRYVASLISYSFFVPLMHS